MKHEWAEGCKTLLGHRTFKPTEHSAPSLGA